MSRCDTGMSRTRHKALPCGRTLRCVYSMNLSPVEDTELQERQNVKGEGGRDLLDNTAVIFIRQEPMTSRRKTEWMHSSSAHTWIRYLPYAV